MDRVFFDLNILSSKNKVGSRWNSPFRSVFRSSLIIFSSLLSLIRNDSSKTDWDESSANSSGMDGKMALYWERISCFSDDIRLVHFGWPVRSPGFTNLWGKNTTFDFCEFLFPFIYFSIYLYTYFSISLFFILFIYSQSCKRQTDRINFLRGEKSFPSTAKIALFKVCKWLHDMRILTSVTARNNS